MLNNDNFFMFRIKDSVYLNVLEKYGFVEGFYGFYRLNNGYTLSWNEFMVCKDTRRLFERFFPCDKWRLVVNQDSKYIQDLIKLDLVEKVEC